MKREYICRVCGWLNPLDKTAVVKLMFVCNKPESIRIMKDKDHPRWWFG